MSKVIQKWLNKQPLVVVGYFDKVKGVNLTQLLGFWLDTYQDPDGDTLADYYPDVADHFQVRFVAEYDESKTIKDILTEFEGCPHVKAWCFGYEVKP